jgi:hypothetical protein
MVRPRTLLATVRGPRYSHERVFAHPKAAARRDAVLRRTKWISSKT